MESLNQNKKRQSFLRRRARSYKKGLRIVAKEVGGCSRLSAGTLLLVCIVGIAAFAASGTGQQDQGIPSHLARHLAANITTTTAAPAAGGSHSCDNYKNETGAGFFILWLIILLYFFLGLAIICDDFFVSSLERISERLNLSEDVAGATFMAAGSSAPELFTSIMDTFYFTNNVGVGTIVGSAVFNILVIIALAAAMSAKDLTIDWRPFLRDCIFYLISVALLFVFVLEGAFTWVHSLILVIFYLCYVAFMTKNESILAKCGKGPAAKGDDSVEMGAVDVNIVEPGEVKKDRKQVLAHMMTVTEDGDDEKSDGPKSLWDKFMDVASVPFQFVFGWTIPDASESSKYKKYYVVTFTMSVVWIAVLSFVLCDMVARIGCMLNVSSTIMGLTVLAAGTSVPDALGSIVAAREGMGDMAVSNAIGSNVFDICLGLGLPYVVKTGIVEGGKGVIAVSERNKSDMLPSIIILAVTVFGTAGIMILNKWKLNKTVGWSLFSLYLLFFIYNVILGAVGGFK